MQKANSTTSPIRGFETTKIKYFGNFKLHYKSYKKSFYLGFYYNQKDMSQELYEYDLVIMSEECVLTHITQKNE